MLPIQLPHSPSSYIVNPALAYVVDFTHGTTVNKFKTVGTAYVARAVRGGKASPPCNLTPFHPVIKSSPFAK